MIEILNQYEKLNEILKPKYKRVDNFDKLKLPPIFSSQKLGATGITKAPPKYYFKDVNDGEGYNYDLISIKTAIRNILSTPKGSMPGLPLYGSNIYKLIFEPSDHILKSRIEQEIKDVLFEWEPRISVVSIDIYMYDDSPNNLYVDINYILNIPGASDVHTTTLNYNTEL